MARPRIKFVTPPVFTGREDPLAWLEQYESTGRYNNWRAAELRGSIIVYLEGRARHWYLCLGDDAPSEWLSTPEERDQQGVVTRPYVVGLRDAFLKEFLKGDYRMFLDRKLRSRVRGDCEDPVEYYYDVLNMCRMLDPQMSEERKMDYLYQGIRPDSLLGEVYKQQPSTCREILDFLKLDQEAKSLMPAADVDFLLDSDDKLDPCFTDLGVEEYEGQDIEDEVAGLQSSSPK